MANLVIDVGNSFTKLAVFERDKIVYQLQKTSFTNKEISQINKDFTLQNVIISSVKEDAGVYEHQFTKEINFIKFNHNTKVPIQNHYKKKEKLGLDRLAAVVGAIKLYPQQPVFVIDAGTCITYDLIDAESNYFGGSISPGLNMRLKAMNHFTSKLPLVDLETDFSKDFGDDTHSAILSGAINGALYEINGFIEKELNKNKGLQIILCGGDATFFDTRLKNSIFAHFILHEQHLVLIGLNKIVNYQNEYN